MNVVLPVLLASTVAISSVMAQSTVYEHFDGSNLSSEWRQVWGSTSNYTVSGGNLIVSNTEGGWMDPRTPIWRQITLRIPFYAFATDSFYISAAFNYGRSPYKLFEVGLLMWDTSQVVTFRLVDNPSSWINVSLRPDGYGCPLGMNTSYEPHDLEIIRRNDTLTVKWDDQVQWQCAGGVTYYWIDLKFGDCPAYGLLTPITIDSLYAFTLPVLRIDSVLIRNCSNFERVLSHQPEIMWTYKDSLEASTQDSFEIEVSSDSTWTNPEMWAPPVFASAETTVVYGGAPLMDGIHYFARIRVHNGPLWSGWYRFPFRMNSVPSVPLPKTPINDGVAESLPILWTTSATDAEGDPLFYDFSGFHDTDCVSGPTIEILNVPSTPDSTGGHVTLALAENCRYWWKVRAFDGFEYSDWSPYAQFYANGTPEPPTTPILSEPPLPDDKPVFTLLPTLKWSTCYDPDPFDTVRYKVELSPFPSFSYAFARDSLLTPFVSLTDSLPFGTHYWWRVIAKDKTGHAVMSAAPKDFWTWTLGDINHSHLCDLSDLSGMVSYLTGGGYVISPKLVGDLNGSCFVDLTDLSMMVSYLTGGGAVLKVGCE